jgi:predicted small metal-binding protein
VAYTINCDCGYVAKGETEEELLQDANAHIQAEHPDLVGKVSREELLAHAEQS